MKQTKRTLVSLLLVFAMLATCLVAFSVISSAEDAESTWGWVYTEPTTKDEDGTILVNTANEFAWITQNPDLATGSYRLMTNVNMNSATNKTSSTDMSKVFSGTLDGNGHYVRNVKDAGGSGYSASGLFRNVSGTIKNLTIKDSTFTADNNADVAAFVAKNLTGTLENCHVVNCTIKGASAAGFAGNCSGTIKDCTIDATTTITGSSAIKYSHVIGGICIKVSSKNAVVENCIVNGSISGTSVIENADAGKYRPATIGGIIGSVAAAYDQYQWNGLKNCVNNATITATHLNNAPGGGIGGLIGEITRMSGNTNAGVGQVTATGCVNNGSITVNTANSGAGVGGLVGQTNRGAFVANDCVNNGDVSAPASIYVGGLLGYSKGGANTNDYGTDIFRNCGQYGAVTGAGNVGDAVGCTYQSTTLENVVLAGSVNLSESAAADALTGTVIAFQTANTANSKTLSDCTVTMNGVYSPVTAALYNTDTAVTGTLNVTSTSVVTGDAFTGGDLASFVTALNEAATANGWHKWAASAAPLYIVFAGDAVQVILDGATLSLDDTMTLKLFVKASSVAEIADLATIMVNDGTKDYAGALDDTSENYVFEIAGLAAKDMGTAKTYTVKYTLASDTANPIVCDTGVEYSPLQYAINMYQKNNGTDANFAALLTSMVRYMDAAGATGAKTTFASATEYIFDDTAAEAAYTEIMKKATEYNIPADTMSLAAELTSGITLLVKPADGKTLTSVKIGTDALTIESAGENTWRVNGLNPGDLYNELTFTFTTEEGTTEVTCSVARYLNNYVGTASETLAKATALYMDAFITYKTIG